MVRLYFFIILLALIIANIACQKHYKYINYRIPNNRISSNALIYFNGAFKQISERAYNQKVDFKGVYDTAILKMENAKTYADTYASIKYVLAALKDNHSFFFAPPSDGRSVIQALSNKPGSIPFKTYIKDNQYGVITIKSYNSVDNQDRHQIADSLYRTLVYFGKRKIKGIIIDLRKMEGGTEVPFLCGFAPLINREFLIGYVDNKGHKTQTIRYKNGIYAKNKGKTVRLSYLTDYTPLSITGIPIAILTSKYTASAGEMILISFLGLDNVRTFGQPTLGVPTGKDNIFLTDGAFISLTSSASYDRKGYIYNKPIHPDVIIDDQNDSISIVVDEWIDVSKNSYLK